MFSWGCNSDTEFLLCIHKALGPIPGTRKIQRKKYDSVSLNCRTDLQNQQKIIQKSWPQLRHLLKVKTQLFVMEDIVRLAGKQLWHPRGPGSVPSTARSHCPPPQNTESETAPKSKQIKYSKFLQYHIYDKHFLEKPQIP